MRYFGLSEAGVQTIRRANAVHPVTALQVELTADDLAAIDTAASKINVQGDRYPEAMQRMIDR